MPQHGCRSDCLNIFTAFATRLSIRTPRSLPYSPVWPAASSRLVNQPYNRAGSTASQPVACAPVRASYQATGSGRSVIGGGGEQTDALSLRFNGDEKQALGRSRGGFSTKIVGVCDAGAQPGA
jgi:hypothetical protein